MRYFPDGQFTTAAFERAEIAAQAVLDEALALYVPGSWDAVHGSSGTIGAVADVLAASGHPPGEVTRSGPAPAAASRSTCSSSGRASGTRRSLVEKAVTQLPCARHAAVTKACRVPGAPRGCEGKAGEG